MPPESIATILRPGVPSVIYTMTLIPLLFDCFLLPCCPGENRFQILTCGEIPQHLLFRWIICVWLWFQGSVHVLVTQYLQNDIPRWNSHTHLWLHLELSPRITAHTGSSRSLANLWGIWYITQIFNRTSSTTAQFSGSLLGGTAVLTLSGPRQSTRLSGVEWCTSHWLSKMKNQHE
jgi:hypothetical protein